MRYVEHYKKELQRLKPHDEVQDCIMNDRTMGYPFIITAGHGYLVVPIDDPFIKEAYDICDFGYVGKHAVYLEEDCEAGQFIAHVKAHYKSL